MSYTHELELLILNTLLPTYEKHWKERGVPNPLQNIHPDLLKQLNRAKVVPALFKPKEKQT